MSTRTRRQALALQALLLGLLVLLPTAVRGLPDDQAKARKDLKKNAKKLMALDQAIAAKQAEVLALMGAPKHDPERQRAVEDEVVRLRDQAGEVIDAVVKADSGDAAELLCTFAVGTQSEDLHERTRSELTRFGSDEAVAWMAGALGQGVLAEEGEGKKRAGRGKRDGGDDAWKLQVLIARVFDGISHEATIPPLAAQIEKGANERVVNACVEAVRRKQDRRLIPALIAMLGRVEKQGGLEYYAVRQALVDQTGEDFFTHERWSGWWTANAETFDYGKRGEVKEAATRERAKEEKVPAFFGSEIASNRVCFIIDTSGSMTMTDRPSDHALTEEQFAKADPDSPDLKPLKRIERARKALIECIKSLQPTQRFNVIAFASLNRTFRSDRQGNPQVVEATEQNKAEAIKFVEALKDDGGTETYAALEAAFKDPLVDTIYLLSDGAPNHGKLGNPGEQARQFAKAEVARVLEMVKRENRFKGVKIHTFGMDGPGVWHHKWGLPRPVTLPTEPEWLSILSTFMGQLASITGGNSKSI